MTLSFNEIFWGDSILEKIEINSDEIKMKIYNDVLSEYIFINCIHCIGMTSIMTWDEDIIENIFLKTVSEQNDLFKVVRHIYGVNSYDSEKSLNKNFYELEILLINTFSFSVVCEKVEFYTC